MSLNIGDTFRWQAARIEEHLWIVLSNPATNPAKVMVVNLTSFHPKKDQGCRLQPGDHRFIVHPTLVHYVGAEYHSDAQLESYKRSGTIRLHDPLRSEVLAYILKQAAFSRDMNLDDYAFLDDQGLVPP